MKRIPIKFLFNYFLHMLKKFNMKEKELYSNNVIENLINFIFFCGDLFCVNQVAHIIF